MTNLPEGRLDLLLGEIGEPSEKQLRLVLIHADQRGPVEEPIPSLPARRITYGDQSATFELIWENYVAYSIRNESYARSDALSDTSKDTFHVRATSAYLEFVRATTIATNDYPGVLSHWVIVALDHVVDVVSWEPPILRQAIVAQLPAASLPGSRNYDPE